MKIIISNDCEIHMEAHKRDFKVNWKNLIKWCEYNGEFNHLHKPFEIIKIKFPFRVGCCNCVETNLNDEIVFAKRRGRDTYTRFVKNKKSEIVNSVIFILKKNREKIGEYYLITAFPGTESFKEPEDLNIKSREELAECLEFWQNHALIYDEEIIDIDTIKSHCPYKNLYIAIA